MNEKNKSFEQAFERLEEILKKLNEDQISLDDSLKLFEEADSLINTCSDKLSTAEQKIEKLIKNRKNELELDNEKPLKEEFAHDSSSTILKDEDELSPFR